jgi:hypothetical protein
LTHRAVSCCERCDVRALLIGAIELAFGLALLLLGLAGGLIGRALLSPSRLLALNDSRACGGSAGDGCNDGKSLSHHNTCE